MKMHLALRSELTGHSLSETGADFYQEEHRSHWRLCRRVPPWTGILESFLVFFFFFSACTSSKVRFSVLGVKSIIAILYRAVIQKLKGR